MVIMATVAPVVVIPVVIVAMGITRTAAAGVVVTTGAECPVSVGPWPVSVAAPVVIPRLCRAIAAAVIPRRPRRDMPPIAGGLIALPSRDSIGGTSPGENRNSR